jgi:hypothetical protein
MVKKIQDHIKPVNHASKAQIQFEDGAKRNDDAKGVKESQIEGNRITANLNRYPH